MKNRNTLTKSLHTVSAVSRLAVHLDQISDRTYDTVDALIMDALRVLGVPGYEAVTAADPLWAELVKAVGKRMAKVQA